MNNKNIMTSLPLVASMLGDSFGVWVKTGEKSTACTDGETIYLPKLPSADETSLGLARGFISQEAGHLRFTDMDAIKGLSPLEKHIWNALEDYRIERRMVDRYPGCQNDFNWLIRHMFLGKSFSVGNYEDNPAFSVLDYILITMRQKTEPELADGLKQLAGIVEGFYSGLLDELNPLLNEVESCQSTQDCATLAERIATLLRYYAEINCEAEQGVKKSPGGAGGGGSSETTESVGITEEAQSSLQRISAAREEDLPETTDQLVKRELCAREQEADDSEPVCVCVETPDEIFDLPDDLLAECLRENCALRTRLTALLQAKTLRRVQPARSGKLSGRLLHRLAVNDSRVFLRGNYAQSVNTAVHILLDRSPSMDKKLPLACAACYCATSALDKIPGVSVALSAFPGSIMQDYTITPIYRRGERITRRCLMNFSGVTPLTEALLYAIKELLQRKERRKLIFVITDGAPDNIKSALKAITQAESLGMELYGIGIDIPVNHLIAKSETISGIGELAPAMFRILQNNL